MVDVTLVLTGSGTIEKNIYIARGKIKIYLKDKVTLKGVINGANLASEANITLESDAKWIVTDTSYVNVTSDSKGTIENDGDIKTPTYTLDKIKVSACSKEPHTDVQSGDFSKNGLSGGVIFVIVLVVLIVVGIVGFLVYRNFRKRGPCKINIGMMNDINVS